MVKTELFDTLRALVDAQVTFVLVGGLAAVLAGTPMSTFDVDIVYETGEDNLGRLARLLERLHAYYRDPAGRRIEPTVDRLRAQRVNMLRSDLGDLDALQEIGNGWKYATLADWSTWTDLDGLQVLVLGLGRVIEAKEIADRPKDRAALFVLRNTLEMRKRQGLPT